MNVLLEAENASEVNAPMKLVKAGDSAAGQKMIEGASGDAYLTVPQGAGKPPEVQGDCTLKFKVDKSARYYLWARVWWLDGCGNSVGVSIDGAKEFTLGQDATYKKWHWVPVKARLSQLQLSAGEHSLKISNREDGVAIDQILLTRNKRYVPVGIEE
jgi:hypothetical protein